MSIHPATSGTVPAAAANQAYAPNNPSANDNYYGQDACAVRVDADALNAQISELRAVIDAVGKYNAGSTTNLRDSILSLIQSGVTDAYAKIAWGP